MVKKKAKKIRRVKFVGTSESEEDDGTVSLKSQLDGLFNLILAQNDVNSKHEEIIKKNDLDQIAGTNGLLDQKVVKDETVLKDRKIMKSSSVLDPEAKLNDVLCNKENEPANSPKTIKIPRKSNVIANKLLETTKSPTAKNCFTCDECFKEYTYLRCLKKHKCPDLCTQDQRKNKKPKEIGCKEGTSSPSETDVVLFQCSRCCQQFQHRRGYLHHTKKEKCITNDHPDEEEMETQSLSSLLNDVYREYLNR